MAIELDHGYQLGDPEQTVSAESGHSLTAKVGRVWPNYFVTATESRDAIGRARGDAPTQSGDVLAMNQRGAVDRFAEKRGLGEVTRKLSATLTPPDPGPRNRSMKLSTETRQWFPVRRVGVQELSNGRAIDPHGEEVGAINSFKGHKDRFVWSRSAGHAIVRAAVKIVRKEGGAPAIPPTAA